MEAAQIFATDVSVSIPGFKGVLKPIGMEVLALVESELINERIASVPKMKDIMDGIDLNGLDNETSKMIIAEVMFNIHDFNKRARSEVTIEDITAHIETPRGQIFLVRKLMKRMDGSDCDDADALNVFRYVSSHGIETGECNIARWFETSGLTKIPDPTKSEN